MAITSRQFIRRSAITAVAVNLGSPLLEGIAKGATRRGAQSASNEQIVVTINMFGGNDGINTVIDLSQYNRYRKLRPQLGIDRNASLPCRRTDIAFNPGMGALRTLYGEGRAAVILGVGAPPDAKGLFDHERAQYEFQSGGRSTWRRRRRRPGGSAGTSTPSNAGFVSPGVDFGGGALLVNGLQRDSLTLSSIDQFQIQPGFDSDARLSALHRHSEYPAHGYRRGRAKSGSCA